MSYTTIDPKDVEKVCQDLIDAWKDPALPEKQFEIAVKNELESYRKGGSCLPYDAFIQCLMKIDSSIDKPETKLLEIGCSSGYYSEVMKIAGYHYEYIGVDYNPYFIEFGKKKFGANISVDDATKLTLPDRAFEIVVSGCCILHIPNYKAAIEEAVRVSNRYVLFHRTPINMMGRTVHYLKEAYGTKCFEIHFSERELMALWTDLGLRCIYVHELFRDQGLKYRHRSYLLERS